VHGKDWKKMRHKFKGKTEAQLKNFYLNYYKKMGLKELLPENNPAA